MSVFCGLSGAKSSQLQGSDFNESGKSCSPSCYRTQNFLDVAGVMSAHSVMHVNGQTAVVTLQ